MAVGPNGEMIWPCTIQSSTAGTTVSGVTASRVPVTSSRDVVLPAGRSDEMVTLKNTGAVDIDLGGSAVTAGSGFPLKVGESFTMDAKIARGALYGITASGSGQISVLRF